MLGGYALTLAVLGSIDSLLTSLVADNITRTQHNSDRELIGQGLGNMGVALLGGLPGAGATMRTVTNVQAGGRTPLSGVVHSLVLLVVTSALGLGLGDPDGGAGRNPGERGYRDHRLEFPAPRLGSRPVPPP